MLAIRMLLAVISAARKLNYIASVLVSVAE